MQAEKNENQYKIEVMVSTLRQENFALFETMNIQTDFFIANQNERKETKETTQNAHRVRMVSTNERGASKNRNLCLKHAEGEILLLTDDDVCFLDEYERLVQDAFVSLPNADVVIFNVEDENGNIRPPWVQKMRRVHVWNAGRYGSVRIAIRRKSVQAAGLLFDEAFGPGSSYRSGEDSIFLVDALRAGLNVYTSPTVILRLRPSESSWFTGFDARYFFDKGALSCRMFPGRGALAGFFLGMRLAVRKKLSLRFVLHNMRKGRLGYKTGKSFDAE